MASNLFARVKDGKRRYFLRGGNPSKSGEYPHKVTGHLRRNVQEEFDKDILTARVGTNVEYGKHLEMGTLRMAARPFMSNGVRDFSAGVKAIITTGNVI
jgi:phage gpG-like protein